MAGDLERRVVGNAWDLARVALARNVLLQTLSTDPRVQAVFRDWWNRRGFDRPITTVDAFRVAVLKDTAADLDRLDRLVRDDLGLDYPWLPAHLLTDFRLVTLDPTARALIVPPDDLTGIDVGRAPKRGAVQHEDIPRNVEWFYRARIKDPRENVTAIAAEYARKARRRTDARSVVQAGIKRAETLLACVDPPDPTI